MKTDILVLGGYYYLIPESITNWIYQRGYEYGETPVPDDILKLYNITEEDEKVIYLSGTKENDKALFISQYAEYYKSIKELIEYVSTNDIEIGEELTGFVEY